MIDLQRNVISDTMQASLGGCPESANKHFTLWQNTGNVSVRALTGAKRKRGVG